MNALEARTIADHSQPTFNDVYFQIEKAAKQGCYCIRYNIQHKNVDKLVVELKSKGFMVDRETGENKDQTGQGFDEYWDYLVISWE